MIGMSSNKKEFLCERCDYPAQSETEFMNPKTELIIDKCPMCGSTKTKTQKIHNFRLTWDMLKGMGIDRQLSELGDVYLQLQEYDSYKPPEQHVSVDIPDDVSAEMNEMANRAQEILNNADIIDFLKEINVLIIIHVNI